jgi:glutathione S-transferase
MTTDQPRVAGATARTGLRAAFPFVWRYMSARYEFSQEAVERSRGVLAAALDRVESERGGGDYLVGESFTVADLTAAALLYPLVWPPEFQYELPEPPSWEFLEPMRDHSALDWIRETWRRHRSSSTAV